MAKNGLKIEKIGVFAANTCSQTEKLLLLHSHYIKNNKTMQTEKIKLSQLTPSKNNPRTITSSKMEKLVMSILAFPKMLELRPIVADSKKEVLGGNMRTLALRQIEQMSAEDIKSRLEADKVFMSKAQAERNATLKWWAEWKKAPYAYYVNAANLTQEERKEFMVKDNVSFGQWDWDALANKFDSNLLDNWGMDVWNPSMSFGDAPSNDVKGAQTQTENTFNTDALPEELQGIDITPADIPEITGTDETLMERIIIVYRKDKKETLANILGLPSIDKVVYNIAEIIGDTK